MWHNLSRQASWVGCSQLLYGCVEPGAQQSHQPAMEVGSKGARRVRVLIDTFSAACDCSGGVVKLSKHHCPIPHEQHPF